MILFKYIWNGGKCCLCLSYRTRGYPGWFPLQIMQWVNISRWLNLYSPNSVEWAKFGGATWNEIWSKTFCENIWFGLVSSSELFSFTLKCNSKFSIIGFSVVDFNAIIRRALLTLTGWTNVALCSTTHQTAFFHSLLNYLEQRASSQGDENCVLLFEQSR